MYYVLIQHWHRGGGWGVSLWAARQAWKLSSKAVGGELMWGDLELRRRLSGKINAA